jgi:hypothetical protein
MQRPAGLCKDARRVSPACSLHVLLCIRSGACHFMQMVRILQTLGASSKALCHHELSSCWYLSDQLCIASDADGVTLLHCLACIRNCYMLYTSLQLAFTWFQDSFKAVLLHQLHGIRPQQRC